MTKKKKKDTELEGFIAEWKEMQEAGNKVRDFFQRYGRTQLASALDRIATDNRAQEEKEATRHAAWESFCLKLAAAGVTKLPSYYDYSRGC